MEGCLTTYACEDTRSVRNTRTRRRSKSINIRNFYRKDRKEKIYFTTTKSRSTNTTESRSSSEVPGLSPQDYV
eukprot:3665206-Amphidinium_carterae.1